MSKEKRAVHFLELDVIIIIFQRAVCLTTEQQQLWKRRKATITFIIPALHHLQLSYLSPPHYPLDKTVPGTFFWRALTNANKKRPWPRQLARGLFSLLFWRFEFVSEFVSVMRAHNQWGQFCRGDSFVQRVAHQFHCNFFFSVFIDATTIDQSLDTEQFLPNEKESSLNAFKQI